MGEGERGPANSTVSVHPPVITRETFGSSFLWPPGAGVRPGIDQLYPELWIDKARQYLNGDDFMHNKTGWRLGPEGAANT